MQLVPMTEAEYSVYLKKLIPEYAAEHVEAGNWTADEAEAKAQAQVNQILPEGVNTPGNYLYFLRVEEDTVGVLWLAVMGQRTFIYDIEIHENFRRQGYATQALLAAEEKAREFGTTAIALHVFGKNTGARALYDKVGYQVTDIMMAKNL
jgi:ribosomal protein S18 acetylase RimI-like enzyme